MDTWMKISVLLCIFGFLKEFRPSEPYVTPYLMGPPMNFTNRQISQEIYPVATYSNMLSLIIVFLVTDFLRYKIVIVADAISGLCVYLGLLLFQTLFAVQVVEVFYGLFMAGEVAYYTYIYAKVDTEHFQEVTSHTRSAYLAGRALSGIVSQALVYFQLLSYYQLQYLTISGLLLATVWAVMLPPVEQSIYFHRKPREEGLDDSINSNNDNIVTCSKALGHLKSDLTEAFTNPYIVKWALWWALATCGYWQVLSYIQLLWQKILSDNNNTDPPLYGIIEAAYTVLGAMASMSMGKVHLDWARVGEPVLAACSLGIALVLLAMSFTLSMAVAYSSYICYTIIYHTMITVANSEVAKKVKRDSYGLIFGVTTFLALVLQSGLTYVVNKVLQLSIRTQFMVYSGYFGFLGVCFLLVFVVNFICKRNRYILNDR